MRNFPYWTPGKIIEVIQQDGLTTFNRMQFRKFEREGVILLMHRGSGRWRTCSTEEAIEIMTAIWEDYYGKEEAKKYYAKLKNRYSNSGN